MRVPTVIAERRRLVLAALVAGLALGALWTAPRVSSAAAAWLTTPPVRATTVAPDAPLVVTPAEELVDEAGAAAAAESPVAAPETPTAEQLGAQAPASTPAEAGDSAAGAGAPPARAAVCRVDPGMRYDMVGLVCDDAPGVEALAVHFRASADGRTWGEWIAAPVERVADGAGSGAR